MTNTNPAYAVGDRVRVTDSIRGTWTGTVAEIGQFTLGRIGIDPDDRPARVFRLPVEMAPIDDRPPLPNLAYPTTFERTALRMRFLHEDAFYRRDWTMREIAGWASLVADTRATSLPPDQPWHLTLDRVPQRWRPDVEALLTEVAALDGAAWRAWKQAHGVGPTLPDSGTAAPAPPPDQPPPKAGGTTDEQPTTAADHTSATTKGTTVNLEATGPDEIRAAFSQAIDAAGEQSEEIAGVAGVLGEAADRYESLEMAASTVGHLRDAAEAYAAAAASLSTAGEQLQAALADFNAKDGAVAEAAAEAGNLASKEVLVG